MKYLGTISNGKDLVTREYVEHYGVCSTGASTRAKVVTIPGIIALHEGLFIRVKFTANQTYNGTPTLNVNGLGAIDIHYTGGGAAVRYEWAAGTILELVYDGTYWVIVGRNRATTSYYGVTKLYTGAASTSDALALTPKTLNSLALNSIWGYPVYSSSATYEVGDRVRYSVGVYECISAIETAESWTAEHWELIPTLQAQIDGKYTKPVSGIPASDLASGVIPGAYTSNPAMDGTASAGSSSAWAKGDHVHPSDTAKANVTTVAASASINSSGLITFKNSSNTSLFTLQLPLYNGGVS